LIFNGRFCNFALAIYLLVEAFVQLEMEVEKRLVAGEEVLLLIEACRREGCRCDWRLAWTARVSPWMREFISLGLAVSPRFC